MLVEVETFDMHEVDTPIAEEPRDMCGRGRGVMATDLRRRGAPVHAEPTLLRGWENDRARASFPERVEFGPVFFIRLGNRAEMDLEVAGEPL